MPKFKCDKCQLVKSETIHSVFMSSAEQDDEGRREKVAGTVELCRGCYENKFEDCLNVVRMTNKILFGKE